MSGTLFTSFSVGATGADGVCATIHASVGCRHGHMYDGHDGGRNRLPCGYGYGLGEGVEGHFGFGREAEVDEVGQGNL